MLKCYLLDSFNCQKTLTFRVIKKLIPEVKSQIIIMLLLLVYKHLWVFGDVVKS